MAHYTVNLCDRDGGADDGVDAITETWTDSVADFMDPDKSFATPEDAQRLFTDHDSFIGAPVRRVRGGRTRPQGAGATRRRAAASRPATRSSSRSSDDAALGRLAALTERDDVTRYVENRVVTPLMTGAFPAVHAFVEVHADREGALADIEALAATDGVVHPVSEYVKK